MICGPQQIVGNQNKKNEIGVARSTYGEKQVHSGFWWGNLRETDNSEDLDVDGKIIFKWILNEWDGGAQTLLICLRKCAFECHNEHVGSIKCGEILV
jgi:hypothetical protein